MNTAKDYGFVPTPVKVVDMMVNKLFDGAPPSKKSTILDPGCGPGVFIDGIIRWCRQRGAPIPRIVGVELDQGRHAEASARFRHFKEVLIERSDFLTKSSVIFDYVIGNPPYVPITNLSEREKKVFRAEFVTASGRFDLYLLFFEQSIRLLRDGGRLVFITPEKFLYVKTARPLRKLLANIRVVELDIVSEETFPGLVTYPIITTVDNLPPGERTAVNMRDGRSISVDFPLDGSSLLPLLNGMSGQKSNGPTLLDACLRVSCGIATGADKLFVNSSRDINGLAPFAYPTISGRQLVPGQVTIRSKDMMLVPYDRKGSLLPLDRLGVFADYLMEPARRRHLSARVCARRKPWHAFHDSVPLDEILQPKLICKDITESPAFWIDRSGTLVPRHSVYYLVPKDQSRLDDIAAYLNSSPALDWMRANCQHAANGFIRLQSEVLKRLPIPQSLLTEAPLRIQKQAGRQKHAELVLSGPR